MLDMPTSLTEILQWLFGPSGGAFIVIGWFAAIILDKFVWWNKMDSTWKKLISVGLASLLGCGSYFFSTHPEAVKAAEPYIMVIAYSAMMWLSNEYIHQKTKTVKL